MTDQLSATGFRRVAITGVGLVTPLGATREETWQGLLAGRRAVDWLDLDNNSPYPHSQHRLFGAKVPGEVFGPDRLVAFARKAAGEAVAHAQLTERDLRNSACVIGTSKIDLTSFDDWKLQVDRHDPAHRNLTVDVLFPGNAAVQVAQDLGCEEAVICPVAACATGLVSVIHGARLIQSGQCPVVVAGSADSSLHPGLLASYRRLGVLANPGDDPSRSCRPFDSRRTGFAVGEGAGVLILEDWEHAQRRSVPILAEWGEGVVASDPGSLTRIHPSGHGLSEVIRRAANRSHTKLSDIQGVSLHATATRLNDTAELAALEAVFSSEVSTLPAFGVKGAIGHLMGAAGSVETAVSVLSLFHQKIPYTVNHELPDRSTGSLTLDFRGTTHQELRHLLKISLGFGGTIAAAILRRSPERS